MPRLELAEEVSVALRNSKEEKEICDGENGDHYVESLSLSSVFVMEFFEFSLGGFSGLPHLPDVVVSSGELLPLCCQLRQDGVCSI